ncbi:399_t:CDS:2, partial [Dentiscutata heterogama]
RQALNDIKKIMAKSGYYSNKISEMDNELADDERRKRIQHPLDDDCNNHVVKIIKKGWQLKKLKQILLLCEDTSLAQNYNKPKCNRWETDIDDNSTPLAGAFSWCISCNYVPAISLSLVINSSGAGGDSDNYLESGAVVSNTYFVSGSAPS